MRYTAVVIDNDAQQLKNSTEILLQCGVFKKVIPFEDVIEARMYIDNNGCDVLFAEVDLDKFDGVKLAKRYGRSNLAMCFVFLTNNKSFAFEAFRLNVTDFVTKPLDLEAIKRVVKKLRNKEYFEIIETKDANRPLI